MALNPPIYKNVIRHYGDVGIPSMIRRRRMYAQQTAIRFGVPVLIKHMYTQYDVNAGVAQASANLDVDYKQPRHRDQISYGTGFASVQTQDGEWIDSNGRLVINPTNPGGGAVPAPRYRGYGPGYLTYAILPDAPEDVFKLTESGALYQTQNAEVQLGWIPEVGDNDLLILVSLDPQENIISTHERFQLKQTTPLTMRGSNRMGRIEAESGSHLGQGDRFIINHRAQMERVPETDPIYQVETDR